MSAYSGQRLPALISSALLVVSCLLTSPRDLSAETRYVSDTLVLNLRDNISKPFKVVATVISEQPLTVLEERDDFLFVETEKGEQGWIAAQYVKTSLPKSQQIDRMQSEIASLKDSRDTSVRELETLRRDIKNGVFAPEIAAATQETERLREAQEALAAEKNALEEEYRNRINRLTAELKEVKDGINQENTRLEELTAENDRLRKYRNIYWFCAGALVFVAGVVTGKIVSRKKKRYML